ncbi:uncharacterized protein EI90DRAFT_3125862 [Cantharellus anzutake]|uniref:uncharacterized protein n=1 Tax=Cantharellus anzutake TaxID=1750568 RepID=UPI001908402A|nr:uncharacterized protein EI90DRAFT_3125862 [Cantharellus anzutake]KAF8328725.1 hypothetical protein EI90DRAFT_3125862 [Cantharellus anzutake]
MSRNAVSTLGSARDAAFLQTAEPAAPAGCLVGPNALAETGLDTPLTWTMSGTFIPYNHAGPSSALCRTVQEWMAHMHAGIQVAKPPKDFVIHSWILHYANTLRSFNFLGNPIREPVYSFTPYHLLTPAKRRKLHNAPQYPRTSPIPSLYSSSISHMPLTFSQNAPYCHIRAYPTPTRLPDLHPLHLWSHTLPLPFRYSPSVLATHLFLPPMPPLLLPSLSSPISVRSNTHLGPNTTPLATLLLLLLLLLRSSLTTPPPFRHPPTLPLSAPILTFGPDNSPFRHSFSLPFLLSPPSGTLLPTSRQVMTFHHCPVLRTRAPLVPLL